jgi:hypothetical protein
LNSKRSNKIQRNTINSNCIASSYILSDATRGNGVQTLI